MSERKKCCEYCYEMIDRLMNQIQELEVRQNQLKKLNNALVESLKDNDEEDHQIEWKKKYEDEVRRSHELQKKILENSFRNKKIEPNPQKKIQSLKTSRQTNLRKMDLLIENMMKKKGSLQNYEPTTLLTKKRVNSVRDKENEIVIKISGDQKGVYRF